MSSPVFLSIVIPAYNEEKRLPQALESLLAYLDGRSDSAEVLIVENGSQDRTLEVARALASRDPRVRVFAEARRGKGLAVRRGMLEAQGEYRFMCDADFSMPPDEIDRFLPPALRDFDAAIASRQAPGAKRYGEPILRHLMGRVFNGLVRLLLIPGIHDTQCGFKCFRGEVAEKLFRSQTIEGFAFDVEVLYLALRNGCRTIEVPIPTYYNPDSRVRIVGDSLQMVGDVLRVRLDAWRGRYD